MILRNKSEDIQSLFKHVEQKPKDSYQEIRDEQEILAARARWPILNHMRGHDDAAPTTGTSAEPARVTPAPAPAAATSRPRAEPSSSLKAMFHPKAPAPAPRQERHQPPRLPQAPANFPQETQAAATAHDTTGGSRSIQGLFSRLSQTTPQPATTDNRQRLFSKLIKR